MEGDDFCSSVGLMARVICWTTRRRKRATTI